MAKNIHSMRSILVSLFEYENDKYKIMIRIDDTTTKAQYFTVKYFITLQ